MSKAPVLRTMSGTVYTQTYTDADATVEEPTAVAVATTGSTADTPVGFTTTTQADGIVTTLNALVADVAQIRKVLNQVINDMQDAGMVD